MTLLTQVQYGMGIRFTVYSRGGWNLSGWWRKHEVFFGKSELYTYVTVPFAR